MYDLVPVEQCSEINKFVIKERENKLRTLSQDKDIFRGYCGSEKQIAEDYAGREILELIQNADDQSLPGGEIEIVLKGDELYFYNDGKPFSKKGIRSLLVPHNSSKGAADIGEKGLGFRALLNEAEFIRIESAGLSIRFGRSDNQEYFEKFNHYNLSSRPPILNTPRVVEPIGTNGHTTLIFLKLRNKAAVSRLHDLIDEVDAKTLLFLQKDDKISIDLDGERREYSKTSQGSKCITTSRVDGVETGKHTYEIVKTEYEDLVENADGEFEPKKAKIILAYDQENLHNNGPGYQTLYSYLPTKIQFPTNWLIHATFDLTTNRADIIENPYNWRLLTNTVDLIFDYASQKLSRPSTDWQGCDYVMGDYAKFDDDLRYGGETIGYYFDQKLYQAKILPTVNNEYISFSDGPYHFKTKISNYLTGDGFEKLLKYADDADYDNFVMDNSYLEYDLSLLREQINSRLSNMSMKSIVALAIEYYNEFKNEPKLESDGEYRTNLMPEFFLDQNGERIPSGFVKYTEPKGTFSNLPDFVKFRFLKRGMYEEAYRQLEISAENFTSSDFAKFYKIRRYRLETIAQQYYREIGRQSADTTQKWRDFLVWLYQNGVTNTQRTNWDLDELKIPNTQGDVVETNDLYLTSDYGYDLYERIYPESEYLIADYRSFGLPDNEKANFTEYLIDMGVAKKPRTNTYGSLDYLEEILEDSPLDVIKDLLADKNIDLWDSPTARQEINDAAWIPLGEQKVSPNCLILQKEFRQDYHNIVGVSREKLKDILGESLADQLIVKLNIPTQLSDFDAETIYGVLMDLPEKDPSGILARSVQRDLAKEISSDDLDERIDSIIDESYADFIADGKVLCKDGKYHDTSKVEYLAEGNFAKAMIAGHHLIDIPKKMGAQKIQKMFGVEKLTVDYEITDFARSDFDSKIKAALRDIKIGLLAAEDITTNEIRKIKSLNISLATMVEIEIDGETRELGEYEFAQNQQEYFIVIPSSVSWNKIRYKPKFIECLADIVVQEIGTDTAEAQRGNIKAIIGSHDVHEEILLNDDGESAWRQAQNELYGSDEISETELINRNFDAARGKALQLSQQYRRSLYDFLLDETVEKQTAYKALVDEYDEWMPDRDDERLAEADFDAEEYVLSVKFSDLNPEIINDCGENDIQTLRQELNESEREVFNNSFRLRDLARFGHADLVRAEINQKLTTAKEEKPVEISPEPKQEIPELHPEDELDPKNFTPRNRSNKKKRGSSGWGGVHRDNSAEKANNGKKAVAMVKAKLESQGFTVEDRTGDAVLDGENMDGDDSVGYDLEYFDGEIKHFVEVKSCTTINRIYFYLSANEYEKAESVNGLPGVTYDVICVAGINSAQPKYVPFDWDELVSDLNIEKYYYSADA